MFCVPIEIECRSAPELSDHMSEVTNKSLTTFGHSLVYKCDEGYSYISGQGITETTIVIECNADGVFQPSVLPRCQSEFFSSKLFQKEA